MGVQMVPWSDNDLKVSILHMYDSYNTDNEYLFMVKATISACQISSKFELPFEPGVKERHKHVNRLSKPVLTRR